MLSTCFSEWLCRSRCQRPQSQACTKRSWRLLGTIFCGSDQALRRLPRSVQQCACVCLRVAKLLHVPRGVLPHRKVSALPYMYPIIPYPTLYPTSTLPCPIYPCALPVPSVRSWTCRPSRRSRCSRATFCTHAQTVFFRSTGSLFAPHGFESVDFRHGDPSTAG